VIFHAYEQDLPWLDEGDRVDFEVAGLPERSFESRIRFIHPTMKENTRTVSVRAEARNPSGELRPGMYATGRVQAELDLDGPRIIVPSSAVLWSGERSIVYVEIPDAEEPTFELREVELGADLGEARIVKSGLEEGERIVTNGSFRVDAAAQLAGKKSMMQRLDGGKDAESSKEEGHAGMEMEKPKDVDLDISGVLEAYLELKNALVGSASEDASEQAIALLSYLDELQNGLSKEAEQAWGPYGKKVRKAAERIRDHPNSLEEQRKAFHTLSDRLIEAVGKWGTGGKKLYKDHCPMAFDGEGADWLSEFEAIKNPYYGEEMLECGSVKGRFGE
jgi:Cu(I)/Ag(I) efflux system membrane fusion protein